MVGTLKSVSRKFNIPEGLIKEKVKYTDLCGDIIVKDEDIKDVFVSESKTVYTPYNEIALSTCGLSPSTLSKIKEVMIKSFLTCDIAVIQYLDDISKCDLNTKNTLFILELRFNMNDIKLLKADTKSEYERIMQKKVDLACKLGFLDIPEDLPKLLNHRFLVFNNQIGKVFYNNTKE